jgi:hypothetical protein
MVRRGLVLNSIVALVAVGVAGVLAVTAVMGDPPAETPPELYANGIEGRDAVTAEQDKPIASLPTLPSLTPEPSTEGVSPPTLPPTTLRPVTTVPAEAAVSAPPTREPEPAPAPAPAMTSVSPSSWSAVAQGMTINARIEPTVPVMGDTVTIFYSVEGAGDVCCGSTVVVPATDTVVATNLPPLGPHGCPMDRVTSWTTSVVVSQPGPFTFRVHGSLFGQFCTGPPSAPASATLNATFQVRPAA